uniref:DNA-directed DNA polymerase n=1 Tax=Phylloscopus fuscatus densovirus TaxID=2794500 RepID=A0A8A4XDP7_9VIRU|nr:MAG: PolB [Phylloscopus fuscatus densovirus]
MALPLDVENPVLGYFVGSNYEEIEFYVVQCLRRYNRSLFFQIHASGMFERDGIEEEIHLPTLAPMCLDPQMPDEILYELLTERYYLSQDTEFFDHVDGSGWTFLPGTLRYWLKLYPCQPNNGADPNANNVADDDDPSHDPTPPPPTHNYFLYAVMEYFARHAKRAIPRVKFLKWEMLRNFKNEMGIDIPDEDFNLRIQLQDLPGYHRRLDALNIRVFSMRGNLLYAKRWPTDQTEDFIDLYLNSAGHFALILNLWSLFKKKHDRVFCNKCIKWVNKETHTCEQVKKIAKKEQVKIPPIPLGRHALVAYADFESIIPSTNRHQISGWGYVIVNKFHQNVQTNCRNLSDPGMNNSTIIASFLEELFLFAKNFAEDDGHETPNCMLCEEPVIEGEYVVGRNFINGRQGTHHLECWKNRKNTMYIFFHNFRGYDSHFLIQEIVSKYDVIALSATSFEKFNLIHIAHPENDLVTICFKDTFNFFTASLAKCVSMVENWVYSPEEIREAKCLFPYDWFDHPDKLDATSLPPAPWYNKLTNTVIDPTPAFQSWNDHGFTTFAQYHDYYMMADVLQLCDVFEELRRTGVDEMETDPAHFMGAPGYTWFLALCQNEKMFKIIQNRDVYLDIQNGIRGGISQAMTRYMNVEDKPNESIFFLDVNSLYSKCMTYKLPGRYLGKFQELPENWPDLYNQTTGHTAIMVVDLIYPAHLHDRDWAYPLAPHQFNDRLCTTFRDKRNYMVHAELLKFYLQRGLILEKFHYMYVFEHDYTLRDYVQGNIEKRRATNSEVMKTLYKLLNNSLYGKTCENVNKYRKFNQIKDESLLQEYDEFYIPVNSRLMECTNILACGENFLVEEPVKEVELNKPIQIGFAILEFAKKEIYNFLAICVDHFGDRVIPIYTDTDSLMFWCDFPTPWKYFMNSPLRELLDFEKVPDHWEVKTHDTNKQSGLWSPEAGGKEIVEYCGLRAKCYCYRFRDNETVVKNKGVPKAAMIADTDENPVEKITMAHYRDALFNGTPYHVSQYAIRSLKHQVSTVKQYKLGLSANDLKRSVTADRAISLPFGYKGEKFSNLVNDADDPDYLDP